MPHDPEKWALVFGQDHAQIKHTVFFLPRLDRGINRRIGLNIVRRRPDGPIKPDHDSGGYCPHQSPGRVSTPGFIKQRPAMIGEGMRGGPSECLRIIVKVSSAPLPGRPAPNPPLAGSPDCE
jgi:hypothetical protein